MLDRLAFQCVGEIDQIVPLVRGFGEGAAADVPRSAARMLLSQGISDSAALPKTTSTRRDDEFHQVVQVAADRVGPGSQLFLRKTHPVDPKRRVTIRPSACGIPPSKCHEGDFLATQPKCVDPHLVSARIGLVGFDPVGTEVRFEDVLEAEFRPRDRASAQ